MSSIFFKEEKRYTVNFNECCNIELKLNRILHFIVFEYLAKQYIDGMKEGDQFEEEQPQIAGTSL